MLNDTCRLPAPRTPNATALDATIKTYCTTPATPQARLARKGCAGMGDNGTTREHVIRSLGALGMDRSSAATFVAMTEQLFS